MLDLTNIHCFVHLTTVGNLTRAAINLGLAQPALTRRIKRLEADLGVTLFDRLPRGVQVTPDGERFLTHCQRVLREVATAEQAFAVNGVAREVLHLGLPGTCTGTLVPQLLEVFTTGMPGCELAVTEGITRRLKDDLLGGALDLAILNNPANTSELTLLPLATEDLVIIDTPSHAARSDGYTLDDFERVPFIVTSGIRAMVDEQLRPFGRHLKVSHEISSPEAIRGLLAAGQGPTIIPVSTFWSDLKEGRLVAAVAHEVRLTRMLVLAHRVDTSFCAIARAVRLTQSAVVKLAQGGVFEAASVTPPSAEMGPLPLLPAISWANSGHSSIAG